MTVDHSPSTPFEIDTGETTIFGCTAGKGPPLLLLHGFPQTHIMWRSVLPHLTDTFSVVCADLRGYRRSGCRDSASDHSPYSKRAMARDMTIVMERLGFQAFNVCGHDRGGRVVYRMALESYLATYCAQLSSWASPMRSPSGPRM